VELKYYNNVETYTVNSNNYFVNYVVGNINIDFPIKKELDEVGYV